MISQERVNDAKLQRMNASSLCLAFVALMCSAGAVCAQAMREPTDVELKAAYCSTVVKAQAADLAEARRTLPASVVALPAFIALEKQNADTRARLAAYLLPKIEYLDMTSMTFAMKRGDADSKEADDFVEAHRCTASGGLMKCEDGAVQPNGLTARMQQCTAIDWLPF
jgi:hypothetical protein